MLVDIKTAAQLLGGVSISTLRRIIRDADVFEPVRVRRRVMIRRAEIEQFVKRSSDALEAPRETEAH